MSDREIDPTTPEIEGSGRRQFLRVAAAAAVGAAVAAIATAEPASAVGVTMQHSASNLANDTTYLQGPTIGGSTAVTLLSVDNSQHTTDGNGILAYSAGSGTALAGIGGVSGFGVTGYSATGTAVSGQSTSGIGLLAYSTSYRAVSAATNDGVAVYAQSASAVSVEVAGTGRLLLSGLSGRNSIGAPSYGLYATGEIVRDSAGTFWACVSGGTPGVWRSLGGVSTAGQLHVIDPTRVYDSRIPVATPLAKGANRVVSIADAISPSTGAVVTADLIPVGATAVAYNLTVAGGTGGGGYLSITSGGATGFTASAINWTLTSSTIANSGVVPVDATRHVKVWCDGEVGVACNFIIDITGYYL